MFSRRQLSVISTSSRLGGKPLSCSSLSSFCANHGSRSWTGGNVDRQRQLGIPLAGVLQGLADERFGERADGVDLLGDRDEDLGADEAELRGIPPREHLEPDELARLEIDLLLVVGNELAGRNAPADAGLELGAEAQFALHLRFEPVVAAAAALLGLVHGDVGAVDQRFAAQAGVVLAGPGDTDRKCRLDAHVASSIGCDMLR
jgi:hypothetical protein